MWVVDTGGESVAAGRFVRDRSRRWSVRHWRGVVTQAPRRGRSWAGWGKAPRAVTCVSACDVMVRELAVPSGFSDADIRAVLAAENPFPQPLAGLYVDYCPLPPLARGAGSDESELRLLLLAAPRPLVDARCQQLAALGLKPAAVLIDAMALDRLADQVCGPLADDASRLLVLLDEAQFALYVMQGGRPVYARRHAFPRQHTTSHPGVNGDVTTREIARAVQLFAVSSVAAGPATLLLAGRYADLPGLAKSVAEATRLTVAPLDTGSVMAHSDGITAALGSSDAVTALAVALAGSSVARRRGAAGIWDTINLLPWRDVATRRQFRRQWSRLAAGCALAVLTGLAFYLMQHAHIQQARQAIAPLQAQNQQRSRLLATLTTQRDQIDSWRADVRAGETAMQQWSALAQLVRAEGVHESVALEAFTLHDDTLRLQGRSVDLARLTDTDSAPLGVLSSKYALTDVSGKQGLFQFELEMPWQALGMQGAYP